MRIWQSASIAAGLFALISTDTVVARGAGAELPQFIVIPAHKPVCRTRFGEPNR